MIGGYWNTDILVLDLIGFLIMGYVECWIACWWKALIGTLITLAVIGLIIFGIYKLSKHIEEEENKKEQEQNASAVNSSPETYVEPRSTRPKNSTRFRERFTHGGKYKVVKLKHHH